MKRTVLVLFLLFFIIVTGAIAEAIKVVPMEDLLKPALISRDDTQIYISETNAKVLIFNAKSHALIKSFGKSGEGPREFMGFALVTPLKDQLLINSFGKISYFTKSGIFKKEIKNPGGGQTGFMFLPINGGFAAQGRAGGADGLYSTVSFFDPNLKKVKEIYRIKIGEKGFSKIDVLNANVPNQAYQDAIFVPGKAGFVVNAIDRTGKLLYRIERKDYQGRKFTKTLEKEIRSLIEKQNPQQYQFLKDRMVFPDKFPIFSSFYIDSKVNLLYLFTWKFKNAIFECFIYDMKGKFVRRVEIPFKMQDMLRPYPLMIYDWKLYQLIDNDESETWEMHITDVKKY